MVGDSRKEIFYHKDTRCCLHKLSRMYIDASSHFASIASTLVPRTIIHPIGSTTISKPATILRVIDARRIFLYLLVFYPPKKLLLCSLSDTRVESLFCKIYASQGCRDMSSKKSVCRERRGLGAARFFSVVSVLQYFKLYSC